MKNVTLADLLIWRKSMREQGRRVVLTNGCFDLIHVGHLRSLEAAAANGDELVVAINGNQSVRQLKGIERPICDESDRANLIAGFSCVSKTVIFPEVRLDSVIRTLRPDVYAKGGDYSVETLDPDERNALLDGNTTIVFVPFVMNRSTSELIDRIRNGTSIIDQVTES
jgi:D-glycero-beta-D-manno-heptose 1-phosphate adenylyltransferase